ncbi:MAG: T9SS type A sorting domain-containing protein [Acidobacteriota bacterium]
MKTTISHFIVLVLLPWMLQAQSAADYLPSRMGSVWRYQRYTLDSMQNQIPQSKRIETDSLAGTTLRGMIRAYLFRNLSNMNRDSVIADVHGDTVAFFNGGYPKEGLKLVSDSLGLGFLPQASGWYPYMKWKSPPIDNRADTLYRHDSTITVDGTEFDLMLMITRTRRPVGSVVVPAGSFNTVTPFEITLTLNWWVWTPLGRRANPFLKLTTVYYIAAGNWIVKETQNSTYFPLTATDNDSIPKFSIPGYVRVLEKMIATGVEESPGAPIAAPEAFTLLNSYPNPFNGATTIRFDLHRRSDLAIRITDILGRCVWERAAEWMEPGAHALTWESGALPSGMYFCRVTSSGSSRTQKLILQK